MQTDDLLERRLAVQSLSMVGYARLALNVAGVFYLLLGVLMPLGLYFSVPPEVMDEPVMMGAVIGGVLGGGCSGLFFGVLNFFTASSLGQGKKWAWYVGVILGVMYTPSLCFPFGILILVGLMGESARRLFLEGVLPE